MMYCDITLIFYEYLEYEDMILNRCPNESCFGEPYNALSIYQLRRLSCATDLR